MFYILLIGLTKLKVANASADLLIFISALSKKDHSEKCRSIRLI